MDTPQVAATDISFRPLRSSDLDLLTTWLSRPHVDRWWRQSLDVGGVSAKYMPRIEGSEPTHVFVIERRGRPIGWIQWYRWADYPKHAALIGAGPEAAGIDLAIGETEMIGRGIGSAAIQAFVESVVFADPAITACDSDPEAGNGRSLRAFEKAGFVVLRTVTLPGESMPRQIVSRDRCR